jgi:U3 small nucleolar RNA-associated protein 24
MISPKDNRLVANKNPSQLTKVFINKDKASAVKKLKNESSNASSNAKKIDGTIIRHVEKANSSLFFRYNTALGPPYRILVDTNFINFSISNKLDVFTSFMDCLLAKCIPIITDCVMAELEKLGVKYRVALRIAKDPRFERMPCTHKGRYADDCLVNMCTQHKCYIVATCDKDLKRRIRKIPGVPIMYIAQHRYSIERFPDVNNAPST